MRGKPTAAQTKSSECFKNMILRMLFCAVRGQSAFGIWSSTNEETSPNTHRHDLDAEHDQVVQIQEAPQNCSALVE